MRNFNKAKGMADIAFIGIIVALVSLVGMITPRITGKPDTPIEQLSEAFVKLQTGQEVDYSAHLKKLPDGTVMATDVKARTTNPTEVAPRPVYITDGKVPVEFRK